MAPEVLAILCLQELSPYVILLTGPTTVANLFYNIATGKMGLVGLWDAVAFDEVADLQKMPKEVITTLKTYFESGVFARGKEALYVFSNCPPWRDSGLKAREGP